MSKDSTDGSGTSSQRVHQSLTHQVIDGDGHWLEPIPVLLDFLRDEGGAAAVDSFFKSSDRTSAAWYGLTPDERLHERRMRPRWWSLPQHTLDRATAMMPALLRERLDLFGIDFAIVYPTLGLLESMSPDTDYRRAFCRALNKMSAAMFADHSERMTPVAVIPSYTPEEAIEEAEYAVRELGFKTALLNGTIPRPVPAYGESNELVAGCATYVDNLVLDSPYDYDPVWQTFVDLKLAVTTHAGSMSWMDRRSPTNFVFNHLGHFAQSNNTFARALFMAGVTYRFPQLKFAFLEGGVGWACNLLSDLKGHWEKRSRDPMMANLRPTALDMNLLRDLYGQYGGKWMEGRIDDQLMNLDVFFPGLDAETLTQQDISLNELDDFSAAHIERSSDIDERFSKNFYFGCEADDPITAWAFDKRMGSQLKPMFSSDISHFDVPDMTEVLEEAYELVEHGLLTDEDFEAFTFGNIVDLHGGMNSSFFVGTVVEDTAAKKLNDGHGV
jgi:predicted TIM-barrel fold metal-dependent hydrolase